MKEEFSNLTSSMCDVFLSLQKDCPSGKLNKKKFIEVYKQFYPTGKAEKFCEYVFRTFDTDGSSSIGKISLIIIFSTSFPRKSS